MEIDERIRQIYEYLAGKKCRDISVYNTQDNSQDFHYVIIVSNLNQQTNKKFALSLMEDMGMDEYPEGYSKGDWIVFDFDDIALHSFIPSMREKYSLDKLYHNKRLNLTKQNTK